MNRQCQSCGGYELDDGTSKLCECFDIVECSNKCGETGYWSFSIAGEDWQNLREALAAYESEDV